MRGSYSFYNYKDALVSCLLLNYFVSKERGQKVGHKDSDCVYLHPDHVLADVVEYLHVLVLAPGGLSDDLLHLTDQHCEHKDSDQPGQQHEDDLPVIFRVNFWILSDRDGGFGGEEEALDIGVPNTVIYELVGPDPLGGGEHIVGAGQEVHEDDHDVDGLDHPDDCGYLGSGVPPVKGSREGVESYDTIEPEDCGPARDPQEDVDNL